MTDNESPPASRAKPEVLVRVENVGKIFCRDLKRSLVYGVADGLSDLLPVGGRRRGEQERPTLRKGEFWANRGVSFDLRRGECLGLIGHNGAGKTTLLKMLNGLIRPDEGRITMHGRIAALIALGAGFNPILTGRENVYVAGAVLGLTRKEIDAKYDEIVDFAGLEEFMNSPVQNYSSGMQVRLGFSVASSLEPDILLLDEVLAVGDMAFVTKCLNRVRAMVERCAVILVSHKPQQISNFCDRILYLEGGVPKLQTTDVALGLKEYLANVRLDSSVSGTLEAELEEIVFCGEAEAEGLYRVPEGISEFSLSLRARTVTPDLDNHLIITVKDQGLNSVIVYDLPASDERVRPDKYFKRMSFRLPNPGLTPGRYVITLVVKNLVTGSQLYRNDGAIHFIVDGPTVRYAPIAQKGTLLEN